MNAKLKKEIKTLLKQKARHLGQEERYSKKSVLYHTVDERIMGETLDAIADQAGELMGKLTTLDVEATPANPQAKIDQNINGAHDMIYNALIDETIRQLTEHKTI